MTGNQFFMKKLNSLIRSNHLEILSLVDILLLTDGSQNQVLLLIKFLD